MITFDVNKFWKKQIPIKTIEVEFNNPPENLGLKKKLDYYYSLPLTDDEIMIMKHSSVKECDIKDLQYRLKRKLNFSELQILKLTSDHGLMIRDEDFRP